MTELVEKVTQLTKTVEELKQMCIGYENKLKIQCNTSEKFYNENEKVSINRNQIKEVKAKNSSSIVHKGISLGTQPMSDANKIEDAIRKKQKEMKRSEENPQKIKSVKMEPVVKKLPISVDQAHQIINGVNPFVTTKYKVLKLKDVPEMKIANLKQAVVLALKLSAKDIAGVYYNREKKYWTLFINQTNIEKVYLTGIDECISRNKNLEQFRPDEIQKDKEYFENLAKNILENPNIYNKAFLIAIKILRRGIKDNNLEDLNRVVSWEQSQDDLSLIDIDFAQPGDIPAEPLA
jgi:nitrous oxide reductase